MSGGGDGVVDDADVEGDGSCAFAPAKTDPAPIAPWVLVILGMSVRARSRKRALGEDLRDRRR